MFLFLPGRGPGHQSKVKESIHIRGPSGSWRVPVDGYGASKNLEPGIQTTWVPAKAKMVWSIDA